MRLSNFFQSPGVLAKVKSPLPSFDTPYLEQCAFPPIFLAVKATRGPSSPPYSCCRMLSDTDCSSTAVWSDRSLLHQNLPPLLILICPCIYIHDTCWRLGDDEMVAFRSTTTTTYSLCVWRCSPASRTTRGCSSFFVIQILLQHSKRKRRFK